MGGTTAKPLTIARFDDPDGSVRRARCGSQVMRLTNGDCSVNDCLDYYHEHFEFTGSGEADLRKRRGDFTRRFRVLGPAFRSASVRHAFRQGRYLAELSSVVPTCEFAWPRREKLDHQRLAGGRDW
jgi:hypothetical protein